MVATELQSQRFEELNLHRRSVLFHRRHDERLQEAHSNVSRHSQSIRTQHFGLDARSLQL